MHYSGILVTTSPERVGEAIRDLESLPGVSVHYCHATSGRLIAVQETDTATGQESGLRRIQGLASVQLAALVEHRIDGETPP